ncbi:MAG: TIGR02186 family protein [Rhodospirillales bacterium]|nr:TIGR02186 family protein [Rhodospirillales bacterium]
MQHALKPVILFVFLASLIGAGAQILKAQDLVIDLSDPIVAITAGFAGTDVLLFGATQSEGDLVVVVRGPQQNHIIRRKERIGGIWINRKEVEFIEIPAFYALAANRPIEEFVPIIDADIHQIGVEKLIFRPIAHQLPVDDITQFSEALIRIKQRNTLYTVEETELVYLGNGLFRTEVHFPANVAVGTYGIDVYLFQDGELVENQTTLLNVRKFGLEAGVFDFAHRHSLAYGVLAVLIAAMAGWLANVAFRKR